MKKGLERYSQKDEGALYTLGWVESNDQQGDTEWCPMHEEPLHIIPERFRADVARELNGGRENGEFRVKINGELCPFCRFMYAERLKRFAGDWTP